MRFSVLRSPLTMEQLDCAASANSPTTQSATGTNSGVGSTVRPEIAEDDDSETPSILFIHSVEPATKDGGWMKPSVENKIAEARQEAGAPQKEFTREEIEKHNAQHDCWLVVGGKVYDATSVLGWHPGGAAAILGHAGKVHQETSDEFASIHDDYTYKKLKECVLGVVTEKAASFIKQNAEAAAKKNLRVEQQLIDRKNLSKDTRAYTFQLPEGKNILGLGTCQHVQIGFHMLDRMLIRSYTPTKPLLPAPGERLSNGSAVPLRDGDGIFGLTVKTYFPDENQPGGALSNILDCMPIGEEVELRGPTGEMIYNGNGNFVIEGYSLLARILLSNDDKTEIRVVDANETEADILLKEELEQFQKKSDGQLKTGHVNEDIIKQSLFGPSEKSAVFLCGPPAMIQKAALPALKDWGYAEDENMFGF
ncbi:nitrate reductase (NADH) [Fusarium coicis]|nr:nitrate reductase (NADH) [Fusarium coicis]